MVNNVYDLVTRTMEQEFPGRVAFRWVEDATGTVKEKTYAEYAQDIRRAAAWFARNIPEVEGKRVVLLSRNCYEYGVNTFGAVLAGAVLGILCGILGTVCMKKLRGTKAGKF